MFNNYGLKILKKHCVSTEYINVYFVIILFKVPNNYLNYIRYYKQYRLHGHTVCHISIL